MDGKPSRRGSTRVNCEGAARLVRKPAINFALDGFDYRKVFYAETARTGRVARGAILRIRRLVLVGVAGLGVGGGSVGGGSVGGSSVGLGAGRDIVEFHRLAVIQIVNRIDSTVGPLLDRASRLVFLLRGFLGPAEALGRRRRAGVVRPSAAAAGAARARTAEAAATAKATAAAKATPPR